MNVIYRLQGSEFEWDANKAQSNIDKHGVTFEEAAEVNDEFREFVVGYSLMQRMLLVVYVDSNRRSRIISARPATRNERRLYESS
jgi:uncharacterized DUF497 family protein